jgi:hypothetical protein
MKDDDKVIAVERKLDPPYVGQSVLINQHAPYFNGERARVAYVGIGGVSVYLEDDFIIDDCVCLNNGEWDEA